MRNRSVRSVRAHAALAMLVACGNGGCTGAESPTGAGHWVGPSMTPGVDAAAPDAVSLANVWPQGDPNPDAGPHGGPGFGSGDASADEAGIARFTCTAKSGSRGDSTLSVPSGGLGRSSLLHVPASYDPATGAMLVLNFHGYSSNALEEVVLARMNPASDARGFVVAYPEGIGTSWNAGDCCGVAWNNSVDDVQFVRDLLAVIEQHYCIDPKRIFATGMSNGGFLAHRLACDLSDRIAAIAPVAGVLGIAPERCNPKRPVPVLEFHGTSDPVVPYNGGTPVSPINMGGPLVFRSVQETVAAWRAKDDCLGSGTTLYSQGDATCVRYDSCLGGSEVTLCTIAGGGHTWPGGVPIPWVGKTSVDISATDTMVGFFNAHPMP